MKRLALPLLVAVVVVAIYSCGDGDVGVAPTPANRAPVTVGSIPEREVPITDTVTVDVSAYFADPDGDRLVYWATTSNPSVVTASVAASIVSVVAVAKGSASVAVAASDPGGLTVTQTLAVTVIGKPGFLNVVLDYPEPDIGAIVLLLEGPDVDSLRAEPDLTAFHLSIPTGAHIFLAGPIPEAGTVLRFWAEDIGETGDYRATLEQAAARSYEQRSVESAKASVSR